MSGQVQFGKKGFGRSGRGGKSGKSQGHPSASYDPSRTFNKFNPNHYLQLNWKEKKSQVSNSEDWIEFAIARNSAWRDMISKGCEDVVSQPMSIPKFNIPGPQLHPDYQAILHIDAALAQDLMKIYSDAYSDWLKNQDLHLKVQERY